MYGRKKNIFYWKAAALILWMGVIFFFSSLPGKGGDAFDLQIFFERKGAHVVEFFILTILFLRAFAEKGKNILKLYLVGGLFSLFYAFTDEFHQLFVFGRTGKISDVLIDASGIILALVSCWLRKKRYYSGKRKG